MPYPYIGEIRMFASNFAPAGWEFCNGQLLPIAEHETLFVVLGTRYGGNGETNFALPNLQSRVPIHFGTGGGDDYLLAESGGAESVTLTTQQMPVHSHPILVTNSGQTLSPTNSTILAVPTGTVQGITPYLSGNANTQLSNTSIAPFGGSQPHDNMQPYLVIRFIISLYGLFPTQT
jgi:microcystin-dependent protein